MRDTVAETIAERVEEMIGQLEAMGLRRDSIIRGFELAVERLKQDAAS